MNPRHLLNGILSASVAFILLLAPTAGAAASLTNQDVVKMTAAGLEDAIIIAAIDGAEPAFDTSPDALISLREAKVSSAVIAALVKRSTAGAAQASAARDADADATKLPPSEIRQLTPDGEEPLRYLNPQMRTAARGLGFGGVATYAVLRGSDASLRITDPSPRFLVSVPDRAQVESYLTLASFAVRRNNSREVLIGGGYMSYSTGIHPDRVIAVESTKAADQSRAQDGFTLYEITPRKPLTPGEYAIILYSGEMQGLVGTWFTGTGNAYFDFGVDP